jgi:hypothetical protein
LQALRIVKTERPVVGFLGAGNVLGAYLGQLDRLAARGLAELGPVCAQALKPPEGACSLPLHVVGNFFT